jgi:hypothetical protein
MPNLIVSNWDYDSTTLAAWVARRRNAFSFPTRSAEFARLLKRKARGRSAKSPRFFGEALVASKIPHREAYYSSAKWLTNRRFAGDRKLTDKEHERLRQALHRHFTKARIQKLQQTVEALRESSQNELDGKSPAAPDLWLIDRRGHHRFIEVKLPGDSVARHQFAGMAAIASVLNRPQKVTVEVIELNHNNRMFKIFCRAISAP